MNQQEILIKHMIRWRSNPLAFIREVIGVEPTKQQIDIIHNFMKYRYIAVRSGNKVGKTAVCSWLILWFMCCFKDARAPCTSPSENQLKKGIWNEVGIWYRKLPLYFKDQFIYSAEALTNKTSGTSWQAYIKTATKENPEVLSGAHSNNILVTGDEASGIAAAIINNILPLIASVNAYFILIGNPLRTSGYFFDLFHGKPSIFKALLHYSSEDSPLMPKETLAAWEQSTGGRDSSYYMIHALGEFPESDEDQLIPLSALDDAKNNKIPEDEYKDIDVIWGIDIGLDHDASVIVKRQGRKVIDIKKYVRVRDSVKLSGYIKQEYERDPLKPLTINIDNIGIGRGTLDILHGWGLPVVGVNVGTKPREKGRFANLKAELWHLCRDWLLLEEPQIPDDSDLIMDLVTPKYQTNPSGKIKIESKEQVKKRIGRSTDTGDALVLTFKPVANYKLSLGANHG